MNRPTWQFCSWWGIALPASVVTWITSAHTLAGFEFAEALRGASFGPIGTAAVGTFFAMLGLPATLDAWLLTPGLYLLALGWNGNCTMLQGPVADVFGVLLLGRVLGGHMALDATGGAPGPWVTGARFDLTQSCRSAFLVLFALIAVALAAILPVRRPRRAAH